MNRLQCELCGSTEIVKTDDDVFQCTHCGCKYTTSQAKKIIFGELVLTARDFEVVGGRLVKYNGVSTEVEVPDSVTVIGKGAFAECSGITKVVMPQTVYLIEEDAFAGCLSLKEAAIPPKVRRIGKGAFRDCVSLKKMIVPDSVTGDLVFTFLHCTGLEQVVLSKNLHSVGVSAFDGCAKLRSVIVPEGVQGIGENAFADSGLEEITLPYSLQFVDAAAFGDGWDACRKLRYINGNADAYFREAVDMNNLPYGEHMDIPATETFIDETANARMREKRCVYCGGRFRGLIERKCEDCGTLKNY